MVSREERKRCISASSEGHPVAHILTLRHKAEQATPTATSPLLQVSCTVTFILTNARVSPQVSLLSSESVRVFGFEAQPGVRGGISLSVSIRWRFAKEPRSTERMTWRTARIFLMPIEATRRCDITDWVPNFCKTPITDSKMHHSLL